MIISKTTTLNNFHTILLTTHHSEVGGLSRILDGLQKLSIILSNFRFMGKNDSIPGQKGKFILSSCQLEKVACHYYGSTVFPVSFPLPHPLLR